ncbi:MAG: radical SAM protein [Gallionellales bacterium RIFCSPLOWO2_12_FULL_59_22]|nr:MAG: radical SAM protein [Betaproteobacteria bacterium RIFCSPLOWO2_02_64_14]OGS99912.1 MAG: radical SAM protein [Gallionellales bacterium RIFCSPLOWO2_02_FULL_59_110]OGT12883.1 MAG: radical SAM protein [Gallionellales bacterium RIFCSPLOWO2_12_FULL_59_22]
MSAYRIAVNVEWTSKCNALCPMCPRDLIENPQLMTGQTWLQVLERLKPQDVFRAVIAGYGEPTTHTKFFEFVDDMRRHPIRFDMVSNGQQLDAERIRHLDGAIGLLIVSFSSIAPDVYNRMHANLDQARVMENIQTAQRLFRHTKLAISLTPMPECLPSLPDTIAWLRAQGVETLTMSPTLYNRGGSLAGHELDTAKLREAIRQHHLRSQEFDFVPSFREVFRQWRSNRFKCIPRNIDIFIAANGDYLYCYNDVSHKHHIGNVADLGIREVLARREGMAPIPALCDGCNMRGRYDAKELINAGISYMRARLKTA